MFNDLGLFWIKMFFFFMWCENVIVLIFKNGDLDVIDNQREIIFMSCMLNYI